MASCYLTTYIPLVATRHGRKAVDSYGLLPFEDGSIRREPDLAHQCPSISCLCRAGKFTPRLEIGDTVGYLTRKRKYPGHPTRHWKLTAVLRAVFVFPSHEEAALWYRSRGMALPSNCMLNDNPPRAIEQSHRYHKAGKRLDDLKLHRLWDREYRMRAAKHGVFVVCEALFRDLTWSAPIIDEEQMIAAFRKVPATQNPGRLPHVGFERLMKWIGIEFPPPCS